MIGSVRLLVAPLLLHLSSLAAEHNGPASLRVTLMPPCQNEHRHRGFPDFMGNSIELGIYSSGRLTINGDDDFKGRPWTATLREVFSTRMSKTLLISPDNDVLWGQVLKVLEQLSDHPFVNKTILLTPKQGRDINDEFCIMNAPS